MSAKNMFTSYEREKYNYDRQTDRQTDRQIEY